MRLIKETRNFQIWERIPRKAYESKYFVKYKHTGYHTEDFKDLEIAKQFVRLEEIMLNGRGNK
jgi:hypothetical protein